MSRALFEVEQRLPAVERFRVRRIDYRRRLRRPRRLVLDHSCRPLPGDCQPDGLHLKCEFAGAELLRFEILSHAPFGAGRAHKLDDICVSLGRFDSRDDGGIGSDTMVVGMPLARAQQILAS